MKIFEIVWRDKGFSVYLFDKKIFSRHKKPPSRRYKKLLARRHDADFSVTDKMEMVSLQFEFLRVLHKEC